MRKIVKIGAFVMLAFLTWSGLGGADVQHPKVVEGWEIGKYGGSFTATLLTEPKTFNRILAKETASTDVLRFLFEGLVESNSITGDIEPALAESWEFSQNGRVWVFHLRPGVYWHDGTELTADDVVFTLDVIYDPKTPNAFKDTLMIDVKPLQYRKIDKLTVEFTLPKPFAPMLRAMLFPIMPRHLLSESWQQGKFNETWTVNTPPNKIVGTGPYRLTEYRAGQHVVLVRNVDYWKVDIKGRKLPYISQFIYRIIGSKDTQALLFQKGETDIYSVLGVEYSQYQENAKKGRYVIHNAGPDSGTLFFMFNQNAKHVPQPQLSWFTNQKFRQAVAHAIDKNSITKAAFGGHAIPQWAFESVAKGSVSNPHVRQYPYDLQRAATLLKEAGFVKGSDGYLRDKQGNIVTFAINTNSGHKQRETVATLLVEDLRKLGMKVTFVPLDFGVLVNRMYSGADWQCMLMGLSGGSPEPNSGAGIWRSSGQLHMWNVGWDKPQTSWEARLNEIYDQGAITLEPAARRRLYYEAQEIVAEQAPIIYTVAQTVYIAVREVFGNIRPTSLGGALHNLEVIYQK